MSELAGERLVIVGGVGYPHVGEHLRVASGELGVECEIVDSAGAYPKSRWSRVLPRLLGHKLPPRVPEFAPSLMETLRRVRPQWLVVSGLGHVESAELSQASAMGVRTIQYSTDDPYNPNFGFPWYLRALPRYDVVFTTRRANVGQLRSLGCRSVQWLPFAYGPEIHRPATAAESAASDFESDVVFIGGADADRVPYVEALCRAGMDVTVFGGYWQRYRGVGARVGGHIDVPTMRTVLARAKLSLCLVRRANRDGHVMRSYEEPAMGACMMFEGTDEHRELYGDALVGQLSFRTPGDLVLRARQLLADDAARDRLRAELRSRVVAGPNRYVDRLQAMLTWPASGERTSSAK